MRLQGKDVLVVGGSSGIGFAVAEGALADGARVVLASSSAEKVARAAQRLGAGVGVAVLDVTDESSLADFFRNSSAFDHIVSTAGDWHGYRPPSLAAMDLKASEQAFRVRFWGALALVKHGAQVLAPGGSITLTGAMIAHRPAKGTAVSTAVAGAIESLTRALAFEIAPMRVNVVCPGPIRTGFWERLPAAQRDAQLASVTAHQLLKRAGEAGEVAEAYLYCMRAGYTTGQVLYVEGGSTLGA